MCDELCHFSLSQVLRLLAGFLGSLAACNTLAFNGNVVFEDLETVGNCCHPVGFFTKFMCGE